MSKQIYFEDIRVGTDVPSLTRTPTTRQLVRYAGASGDFYEIHYDKEAAQDNGLPGVIVHGALKSAFLAELITNWIGDGGVLKKLTCRYLEMDFPGDPLTCKGKVIEKYNMGGESLVACEIWVENSTGRQTTLGSALVSLPSRKK